MRYVTPFLRSISVGLALFSVASFAAQAGDWFIHSPESTLAFSTVKASDVIETHHLNGLTGTLTSDGVLSIHLAPASVDTGIQIRNERILKHIFKDGETPAPTLTAKLDKDTLSALTSTPIGTSTDILIESELTLAGHSETLDLSLTVVHTGEASVIAFTNEPIVLDARALGLADGVEILRNLAGLESISPIVPVSVRLTFHKN